MDELPPYRMPPQNLFSYESINKNPQDDKGGTQYFTKFSSDGVFVEFKHQGVALNPDGWKMHISLLEDDENVEKAWNVTFPILIHYQIQHSKTLRRGNFLQEPQQGKEITIYFQEGDINWEKMFQKIEEELLSEGVLPDCKPLGDLEILGSKFLSCRCDVEHPLMGYVSNLEAASHNPSGKPHLFEALQINCASNIVRLLRHNENRVKDFYTTLQENYSEVLGEFRKRFDRFGKVPIFLRIKAGEASKNYRSFPMEVTAKLEEIIALGKDIEKMRRMTGHMIEKMDEERYQIYFLEMLEKFKRMKELMPHVVQTMKDNPESAPHSSEGSVVERRSDGKVKKSSSEERVSSSDAVESTSSEENENFQQDFSHRMSMSPRGSK